jgi:hypothetical protein
MLRSIELGVSRGATKTLIQMIIRSKNRGVREIYKSSVRGKSPIAASKRSEIAAALLE